MKNKVTVTRANRLNLVKYKDYAVLSNVSKYLIEADGTVAVVNNEGNAIYIEARRMHSHLWSTYDMVCPMDNFEDVAKWVANGRKLEDLCDKVDGVELGSLPRETRVAFIFKNNPFMVLSNGTIFRLDSKATYDFPNAHDIVHPLGVGDTITIEVTEQL